MSRVLLVLGLSTGAAAVATPVVAASPAPDPPVITALTAGAAVTLAPLAIGGAIAGTGRDVDRQNAGLSLATFGLVLGPIVSHAIVGEWGRGALYGAVPLAGATGAAVVLAAEPGTVFGDEAKVTGLYTVLVAVTVFAAGAGLIDTALSPERAHPVTVVPRIAPGHASLAVDVEL